MMMMMATKTSVVEEEGGEEEEVVDIDQLVDHYLQIPVSPMQDFLQVGADVDEVMHQQHDDGPGMLQPRGSSEAAYMDEGGLDDIEAMVECILRGDRHHEGDATLLQWDAKEVNENDKEDVQQAVEDVQQHSPLPKRVERDHVGRRSMRSVSSQRRTASADPLLRRLMLWQERRDAKRLQAVYEALLQEQAECTFRPQRQVSLGCGNNSSCSRSSSSNSNSNAHWESPGCVEHVNGVDTFLQRMAEARSIRERKQRKDEEEALRYSDTSTWNPKVTVPQPFELGRKPRKMAAASASMDTFGKYAASIRKQLQNEPSQIEGPSVPSGLFSVQSSGFLLQHVPQRTTPL